MTGRLVNKVIESNRSNRCQSNSNRYKIFKCNSNRLDIFKCNSNSNRLAVIDYKSDDRAAWVDMSIVYSGRLLTC